MMIVSPADKLRDYQDQLAFVQSELISDRVRLANAKAADTPASELKKMEQDIANLEIAVDQIQAKILQLKSQLA